MREDGGSFVELPRDEGPLSKPFPWLRVIVVGCAIVAGVAGLYFLFCRTSGRYLMGTMGVVGMYCVAVAVILLGIVIAPALLSAVAGLKRLASRIAAAVAILAAAAVAVWFFVVMPLLDIPYLSNPSTVALAEASVDFDTGETSVFYHVRGVDPSGDRQSFYIDCDVYDFWDARHTEVEITFLPHSRTVLKLDYR